MELLVEGVECLLSGDMETEKTDGYGPGYRMSGDPHRECASKLDWVP